MNLKRTASFLLPSAAMLLMVARGDTQTADIFNL
jgi:hypothetical protein